MKILRWWLLVAVGLAPNGIRAENLMDILDLARANDPQLKAAETTRAATHEDLPQSLAQLLPSLSLDGSWTKFSQDILSVQPSMGVETGTQLFENRNLFVNLRQTVFNKGSLVLRRLAKVNVARADVEYERAQQDFILRVAERYFAVLSALDSLEFARAEKNAIARQLEQAKQRFDVGLIAITDVHEAQARHDLAIAQEIEAENGLANAREALREITGVLHQNLLLLRPDTPLVPPTPTNIDEWTATARDQNLALVSNRHSVDAARTAVDQQRAARYPTLGLGASYGYFDRGSPFGFESRDAWVSLDAALTLYAGGAVESNIRRARLQYDTALLNLEQLEREVLRLTRNAYLGVLAGMSHVKALKQALISSESALKATEAGFEVGTRTAVEVLDAQREMFRARRDYASARYDYILNTLRLKQAVGMLSGTDLQQVNTWLQ